MPRLRRMSRRGGCTQREFRISIPHLNPSGSRLTNPFSLRMKSEPVLYSCGSFPFATYGNCRIIGPSFSPSPDITDTNSFNSASQSSRYLSWLMTLGTLAEKMKPSGVLDLQASTILGLGMRYHVESTSTVPSLPE